MLYLYRKILANKNRILVSSIDNFCFFFVVLSLLLQSLHCNLCSRSRQRRTTNKEETKKTKKRPLKGRPCLRTIEALALPQQFGLPEHTRQERNTNEQKLTSKTLNEWPIQSIIPCSNEHWPLRKRKQLVGWLFWEVTGYMLNISFFLFDLKKFVAYPFFVLSTFTYCSIDVHWAYLPITQHSVCSRHRTRP